jgi:EF-P beta-lysylation protein EpmB
MLIIPKKTPPVETHWQKELANSFTTLDSLLQYLQIDPSSLPPALSNDVFSNNNNINIIPTQNDISIIEQHSNARRLFPMRVPKPFADLMQQSNWYDPLLQQVVPQQAEFVDKLGFVADPLQEQNSTTAGLIHKYKSRVLLLVRGGCAINCRYCFRRHFPYQDNQLGQAQYQSVLAYIKNDTNINEVIFSGGDPLMANDKQLAKLAQQVDNITHIKRLRIHTRLPVVIPSRVNNELLAWLTNLRIKPIIVLHINHKNEIGEALIEKTKMLKQAGVTLLNQSVLLKNINDSAEAICELSEALFEANILPYYLHMFDPVKGAAHFDVSKPDAQKIMAKVITRLPGFLVPKLVQELPRQPGKTPIDLGLEP